MPPKQFTNLETRPDVLAKSKAEFDKREQESNRRMAYQSRMPYSGLDMAQPVAPPAPQFTAQQVKQLESMGITTLEQLQGLLGILAHPANSPSEADQGISGGVVKPTMNGKETTNSRGQVVPQEASSPMGPAPMGPKRPTDSLDAGYVDPTTREWVYYAPDPSQEVTQPPGPGESARMYQQPQLSPVIIDQLKKMYAARMPRQ